ncbi:MAG: carboxypeptidase-like regulatory domain-containing protein [Candidatus Thermoplasmatota archaeon]
MRFALVVASLAFVLFSGCLKPLEGAAAEASGITEENVRQAADAVERFEEENARFGHISGTVRDADGNPVGAATLRLASLNRTALSSGDGSFILLDVAPGTYTLEAAAEEFLSTSQIVEVVRGLIVRPAMVLEPAGPTPYTQLYRFDGYSEMTNPIVFGPFCACDFELEFAEGLDSLVLEAVLDENNTLGGSHGFYWDLWTDAGDNATTGFSGAEPNPMMVQLSADELGAPTWGGLHVQPESALLPEFGIPFTVYATAFYHSPAPDGYSALAEAAEP